MVQTQWKAVGVFVCGFEMNRSGLAFATENINIYSDNLNKQYKTNTIRPALHRPP